MQLTAIITIFILWNLYQDRSPMSLQVLDFINSIELVNSIIRMLKIE